MNFKFSNWFENNTPKFAKIIGDIALVAAVFSANFLVFKQYLVDMGLTSLANSPYLDRLNAACLFIGVVVKFLSKFFGGGQAADAPGSSGGGSSDEALQMEVQRVKQLGLIPDNWQVTIKK